MKKFAHSLFTQPLLAFLFLVLVAGQSLTAQEKYTLKNGYAPGKYEKVMEINLDGIAGGSVPLKDTHIRYLTIDASENNADGTQKIVAKFTRETLKSTKPIVRNYDSGYHDADNNTPIKQPPGAVIIVGLKITTLYDQDGNPIKSEGADEFFQKLMAVSNTQEADMFVKTLMTDESGQITADRSLRFNGIRLKMPNVPVAVGETWKTEVMMDNMSMGKVKVNVENTLTEIKTENGRKIAVISMKVAHHSDEPMTIVASIGYTITQVVIRADAIATVDIESGLVLKIATDADIEFENNGGNKSTYKAKTTVTTTPKAQ